MELVEGCLKDYDGLINLIDIIKEIFNTLCNKIDLKLMYMDYFLIEGRTQILSKV